MRKTNLLKGVVCGLMLTTVMGSVAYAKSDFYREYLGINGNGSKEFTGSAGKYEAKLTKTYNDGSFIVSAASSSSSYRYYSVEAKRVYYYDNDVFDIDSVWAVMKYEDRIEAAIARNYWSEEFDNYVGNVVVYNGTSTGTGVFDNFGWIFYARTL